MSRLFLLALPFLAHVGCKLHEPTAEPDREEVAPVTDGAVLRLTVVAAATGQPVTDYRLKTIHDDSDEGYLSGLVRKVRDPSGRSEITGIPAGRLGVAVKARGHVEAREHITLSQGETRDLVLGLERGLEVGVTVLSDTGEPVKGAHVAYLSDTSPLVFAADEETEDSRLLDIYRTFTTGADGRCRLDSLVPEKYFLWVSHRDYVVAPDGEPGFEIPADAGKELVARLIRTGRLEGRITNWKPEDFRKEPREVVLKEIRDKPGDAYYSAGIDSGGKFEYDRLPPSGYEVFLGKVRPEDSTEGEIREGKLDMESGKITLGTVKILPGKTERIELELPALDPAAVR